MTKKERTDMSGRWPADKYKATWIDAVYTVESRILPNILSHIDLEKGSRVLECGIGSGKWSAGFALLGYRVYAMDDSKAIVEQAYANFPNITFQSIEKDVRDPPLIDPPVDLLVSEGLVEHFMYDEERKQVLTNFYDAVNGYVSIIVPYKSEEEDEIFYTKKKLRDELKEIGFSILNSYTISFLSRDKETIRTQIGVNAEKK